jgi:hypothetical protein
LYSSRFFRCAPLNRSCFCSSFIFQKLLLGDAPPSHTTPNGLFLFADDDAQPSAASNVNANAGANGGAAAALGRLGVYLPDDALLRTCGLTGKVLRRYLPVYQWSPLHVDWPLACISMTGAMYLIVCVLVVDAVQFLRLCE